MSKYEDLQDYIRCYLMNAYHNLESGDADIEYINSQLEKAKFAIESLQRLKVLEAVNA